MPKQELLSYIQKKLHEGMDQNTIIYKLTSHGWPLVEIHEGFNYLAVMNSPENFYMPTREHGTTPTYQSSAQVIDRRLRSQWFYNPSIATGALMLLLVTLLSAGFLFLNPLIMQVGSMAVVGLIISILSGFLGGVILNLITRILSVEGYTLAKAFVYMAIVIFAGFVFGLFILIGLPSFIPPILSIIFAFVFFMYYYKVSFLKSLAGFGLSIVFGIILSIIGTIIGLLFGISLIGQIFPSGPSVGGNPSTGIQLNF